MDMNQTIALGRDCEVIEVPSGIRRTLAAGASLRIMQSLGGSYTVTDDRGQMFRVDAADADALGLAPADAPETAAILSEQVVWDQLRTVFDPEIPVNLVDLGLIYSCVIAPLDSGGKKIDVKMSITAPGCGMGNVLKSDVESKLAKLPEVKQVNVEIVFDPPWNPGMMSEAAKLQLGLDADYSPSPDPSSFSPGSR
ncbi:MAG TPA: putative Fe-S cluster assembly protein SufT [Candidatus Dormibacteraeota bacterium]|nr:putative Fe-S cluster assembly protein SufT [Candidatus Dormibacteraeota bacterium]